MSHVVCQDFAAQRELVHAFPTIIALAFGAKGNDPSVCDRRPALAAAHHLIGSLSKLRMLLRMQHHFGACE